MPYKIRNQIQVDELTIDYGWDNDDGWRRYESSNRNSCKYNASMSKNKINLNMINQGSSEISMMFGIDEHYSDIAVQAIYDEYFTNNQLKLFKNQANK